MCVPNRECRCPGHYMPNVFHAVACCDAPHIDTFHIDTFAYEPDSIKEESNGVR